MREEQFHLHLGKILRKALDSHPDRDVLCHSSLIEVTLSHEFVEHLEDFIQGIDLESILEDARKKQ